MKITHHIRDHPQNPNMPLQHLNINFGTIELNHPVPVKGLSNS